MSETRRPVRFSALALLAALAACRIANESEVGADAGAGGNAAVACAADAECAGACPVGSVGCACVPSPSGRVCAPTCARPMDCPLGTLCAASGVCIPGGPQDHRDGGMHGGGGPPDGHDASVGPGPEQDAAAPPPVDGGGPPGPKPCQGDADCAGACPAGALGCVCNPSPQGTICVPTCDVAADCPQNPGGPELLCNAGVCVPQQKP